MSKTASFYDWWGIQLIMKNLSCLLLFALSIFSARAESILPGGFNHIITVTRYTDYGKGFLTITDANEFQIKENYLSYLDHYTYEYVDEYKEDYRKHFVCGDLILEVDGVSASDWSEEKFYSIIDGRNDTISLKIRAKRPGVIYDFETKIHPLRELPDGMKAFGNIFADIVGDKLSYRRKNNKASYEERSDEDFDFFPCLYYDYLITSDDPLLDKEILKEVTWGIMERNEEKPDLLITIARDASENISSTYVPPSSRVINVGSTTETRYNWITRQNDYITKQKNRVINEGGYTKETKTSDLYLEIDALDVKKLNDKGSTHPPIVWETTAKRHVINPEFNYNDELKAYASWMALPPGDRSILAEKTLYAPTGIICSETDKTIIKEIIKGSRAELIGLLPGDKIIKAESSSYYNTKYIKKNLKRIGWDSLGNSYEYNLVILRNGIKMNFILPPLKIEVQRPYWVG